MSSDFIFRTFPQGKSETAALLPVFSSVLEPAHLHRLLQFCWHDFMTSHCWRWHYESFSYILHYMLESIFICLRGSEPHCLLLIPASFLLLRLCLWPWSLLRSPAFSFMGLLGPSPLMRLFSSVGSCYLSCLGCMWLPLTQDRIHLPPFSPMLMRTPLLYCWQCCPSQSPAGQSYRLPSEGGPVSSSLHLCSGETTRKKSSSSLFFSNLTTSVLGERAGLHL